MINHLANVSLEPRVLKCGVYSDNRGYFTEVIKDPYRAIPGFHVAQVNASWSIAGVFRGLHAQLFMDKAMYVSSGKALIFAVNIDPHSKLYGQVIQEEMEAGDGKLFYAPWWWARGFVALTDATITYFCSAKYNGADEVAINYKSFPEVLKAVDEECEATIISEKDTISPLADKDVLSMWVKGVK